MEANKCKVCIYVGRTWSRRRTFVKLCDFHQNVMICLRAFIMLNRNVACMEGKRDGESGVWGNREGLRVFEENLGEDGGGFCFLGASRQKTWERRISGRRWWWWLFFRCAASVARKKKRVKVEQALMWKIVAVFFLQQCRCRRQWCGCRWW